MGRESDMLKISRHEKLLMGRKKLVDKYRVRNEKSENSAELSLQARFQQYLEKRVEMIANYIKVRWGVKPQGYFNAIELSSIQTSWGTHYILNIIIPRDIKRANEIERAIVKYATHIVPVPEMLSIKVYDAIQLQHDVDMISIEAKFVLIAIPD